METEVEMEVSQARAFLVLAEELHFGRAAERLHMTQPPFSRLIRQIENETGLLLFSRSTRQVELTAAGSALVSSARDLVETAESLEKMTQALSEGRLGEVKLAFTGSSFYKGIADLARLVRSKIPNLDLQLLPSKFSPQGLEGVLEGDFDLAIGRWDSLPSEVESLHLGTESICIAVPAGSSLAKRTMVTMEELSQESWVMLPGGRSSTLNQRLLRRAKAAGFEPQIVQQSADSWTQMALISGGVGIAFTLDSVRDSLRAEDVSFIALEPRELIDVHLIWRKDNDDPVLTPVLELARYLWPGDEG